MKKLILIIMFILTTSVYAQPIKTKSLMNDFIVYEFKQLQEMKQALRISEKYTKEKIIFTLLSGKVKTYNKNIKIFNSLTELQYSFENLKDAKIELHEELRDKEVFTKKMTAFLKKIKLFSKMPKDRISDFLKVSYKNYIEHLNFVTLNTPSITPAEDTTIFLINFLKELSFFYNDINYQYIVKNNSNIEFNFIFKNQEANKDFQKIISTITNTIKLMDEMNNNNIIKNIKLLNISKNNLHNNI